MAVQIFCCYAHEDEALLNKLKAHLRSLQRQGIIDVWHDRNISAGTEWEREITQRLNAAQIILLLISPDFINSDYCYSFEMKLALERHDRGEAYIIPIILRHVLWQGEPFGKLQALPTDAQPVISTSWQSLDEAFLNVAQGIQQAVKEHQKVSAHELSRLAAYELALQKDPVTPRDYYLRGSGYFNLKNFQKAITDYEQAIQIFPQYSDAIYSLGLAYYRLQEYQKALDSFSRAIQINSKKVQFYSSRSLLYFFLANYQKAIIDFDHILALEPNNAEAKYYREKAYNNLGE